MKPGTLKSIANKIVEDGGGNHSQITFTGLGRKYVKFINLQPLILNGDNNIQLTSIQGEVQLPWEEQRKP